MLGGQTLGESAGPARPAKRSYDLIVIGGGSGGFGAALAGARAGLSVLLVEKADCLGGTSVRTGVNAWEPGCGGTGIPFDLYKRLKKIPQAVGIYSFGRHLAWYKPKQEKYRYPGGETVIDPKRRYLDTLKRHGSRGMGGDEAFCRENWHGVVFEPDAMAATMKAMLEETGRCELLLNTAFVKVKMRVPLGPAPSIGSIELACGAEVSADFYVDSTGDGLVCESAGCTMCRGQEARNIFDEPHAPEKATERINGVTLLYRTTRKGQPGVEDLPQGIPAKCWWRGSFPVAHVNTYPNGDLNVNMLPTMEGQEFLNRGYQKAYEECRRRVLAHWHDLQTRFEEFRSRKLAHIFPALGVRESQRLLGRYVLREQDLRAGVSGGKHPDIICLADHSMDTHGSHAAGGGEMREPYGIPYRCLLGQTRNKGGFWGGDNLLVACRAASFSSLAASSCRLSRTMMQLGQAAGTAVAIALTSKCALADVDAEALRDRLRRDRVQLEHPMGDDLKAWLAKE